MTVGFPVSPGESAWNVARVFYPAGTYRHPPNGLVQLRVVRRGSSYADIDLGLGTRRVFTRPGDLMLSLPQLPTRFDIVDGRELSLLQVSPDHAARVVEACGRTLDDLTPLLRRPMRDPMIAEVVRRLEGSTEPAIAGEWALGVVFSNLLRLAQRLGDVTKPPPLSGQAVEALLARVRTSLTRPWTVDEMAREVGLPRRTFAAAFKEATGTPVHQYLLRLRAEQAVTLLLTTDLPIAEVAHQAGFAHQSHLTRVLTRLKQRTPRQIRSTR